MKSMRAVAVRVAWHGSPVPRRLAIRLESVARAVPCSCTLLARGHRGACSVCMYNTDCGLSIPTAPPRACRVIKVQFSSVQFLLAARGCRLVARVTCVRSAPARFSTNPWSMHARWSKIAIRMDEPLALRTAPRTGTPLPRRSSPSTRGVLYRVVFAAHY